MLNINKNRFLFLVLIICLAAFLRFYKLEEIPTAFHHDEASQAYNAFSLKSIGHDRYGEQTPLLFRSFGSYQPPIYTYLSALPVAIFGNTVFAIRFISALMGVLVVIFTYFIITELIEEKFKNQLALLSSLLVAISPWAIHFSRRVVEANVGLGFFVIALYFFIRSLKFSALFPVAMIFLGLSTHSYYSERVIAILFIPLYLFLFRKYYLKNWKSVILGFIAFGLTQIPHLFLFSSGAYSNRFGQVSYLNHNPTELPYIIYVAQEFLKHFTIYLSPTHLFADTGSQLARISPNLGTFYSWFFIPFLIGVFSLFKKNLQNNPFKILLFSLPIFIIPASLTGDQFYPLRILEYLWVLTIIISFGLLLILNKISKTLPRVSLLTVLLTYSLFIFYTSYGILYKYESNEYNAKVYKELNEKLTQYPAQKIIVDSWRDPAVGLRIAYFRKSDPEKISQQLRSQIDSEYYTTKAGIEETLIVDNIEFRPFKGEDANQGNTILVGDLLAISDDQAKDKNLTPLFEIKNYNGTTAFKAYTTDQQ